MIAPREMVFRTVSALVLSAALIFCLYVGWPAFHILVSAGGALIGWEWMRMTVPGRVSPFHFLLSVLVIALAAVSAMDRIQEAVIAAGALGLLGCLLGIVTKQRSMTWAGLGVVYVCAPMIALIYIHDHASDRGTAIVVWLFLIVAATDIGAFFFGRTFGGPKLAPQISPAKTWWGAVGGLVLAMLASLGFAMAYRQEFWLVLVLGGGLIAIISQLGDLLESSVKRRFDVKDAGNIIPGHGGLLDRVDGIVPAAPVLALYLYLQGSLVI